MRLGKGTLVAAVIAVVGGCGRSGFDDTPPGLVPIEGAVGVRVSAPGSLVLEDGYYDVAPALGTAGGYALAWVEYAAGDRTPRASFAVIAENGSPVVAPRTIELFDGLPDWIRLFTNRDGYVVVFDSGDVVFAALDATGAVRARRADSTFDYADLEMTATDGGYAGVFSADNATTGFTNTFWFQLDGDGNLIAPPTAVDPQMRNQQEPAIAHTSTGFGVVWVETRTGDERLWFRRLDTAGAPVAASRQVREDGRLQGVPLLVPDGQDGYFALYDGLVTFPQELLRLDVDGAPMWPAPVEIYDEPFHHDTSDIATSSDGGTAIAWITALDTRLGNVKFTSLDAAVTSTPAPPASVLVTDPRYSFCYPEVARGLDSSGIAFSGEVEGSLALFLVIVPD